MVDKSKNYEFKGNWIDYNHLPLLARLDLDYFDEDEHVKEREILRNGLIQVRIHDELDFNPDPSTAQLNTLNYIKTNEERILQSIHKCLVENVVPNAFYKDEIEDLEILTKLQYNFLALKKHNGRVHNKMQISNISKQPIL